MEGCLKVSWHRGCGIWEAVGSTHWLAPPVWSPVLSVRDPATLKALKNNDASPRTSHQEQRNKIKINAGVSVFERGLRRPTRFGILRGMCSVAPPCCGANVGGKPIIFANEPAIACCECPKWKVVPLPVLV